MTDTTGVSITLLLSQQLGTGCWSVTPCSQTSARRDGIASAPGRALGGGSQNRSASTDGLTPPRTSLAFCSATWCLVLQNVYMFLIPEKGTPIIWM